MPESPVMFEVIEDNPGTYDCHFCGHNPATLKCTRAHDGDCWLPCACNALATLAQWTVDHRIVKTG